MANQPPPPQRLHELLAYDPATGALTWRASGKPAGSLNDKGYIRIRIDGRDQKAHRLAWCMMTGEWPAHEVDHENRVRSDNRWINLRPATSSQNKANLLARQPSASGYKGVYWSEHAGRWRAELTLRILGQRRKKVLGYFDDPDLAAELRELAGRMVWGEFYREQPGNQAARTL